jgi:hypothetical protein
MTLSAIIATVRSGVGSEEQWLLIAGDEAELSLTTDCELAEVGIDDETDQEIYPFGFEERGLRSTIDYQTLEGCIRYADRLSGCTDNSAACEIIRYYLRFDTVPAQLGAPDPPPREVVIAHLDREFYDALGPERPGTRCRREDCTRGAVSYSAFCRPHHFENVKKKTCPFSD